MMNRMMKAEACFAAQALDSACVILHAVDARSGGHLSQDYKDS